MTLSIPHKIRLALESLGSTADEVAQTLSSRGITGRRNSGCDCPVARFLQAEVPETARLWWFSGYWVDGEYIQLPLSMSELPETRVDVPQPVYEFVLRFDSGDYPDLEATP